MELLPKVGQDKVHLSERNSIRDRSFTGPPNNGTSLPGKPRNKLTLEQANNQNNYSILPSRHHAGALPYELTFPQKPPSTQPKQQNFDFRERQKQEMLLASKLPFSQAQSNKTSGSLTRPRIQSNQFTESPKIELDKKARDAISAQYMHNTADGIFPQTSSVAFLEHQDKSLKQKLIDLKREAISKKISPTSRID